MTAWELRDDLALYRDGALVGMLLDRDTAAEVVDSLRTSGEANARVLEDNERRVQDLLREFRRQMTVLERRAEHAEAGEPIRRVSAVGVDNPVASVTLHGVDEPGPAPGDLMAWRMRFYAAFVAAELVKRGTGLLNVWRTPDAPEADRMAAAAAEVVARAGAAR